MYIYIILSIILIIIILALYINKQELFANQYDNNNYYNDNITNIIDRPYPNTTPKNIVIPLNIFTHWHTKDLKPGMLNAINMMKEANPEFKFHLYDNDDCRAFIEKNFDSNVLTAYDCLIPQAYKSDLWRYCILYIYGGIYYDIKFIPVNGFKLINLMDKEHFVLEQYVPLPDFDYPGIFNGLIISKPNNIILKDTINQIVENVKIKYYGNIPVEPTGPFLLSGIYKSYYNYNNIDMFIDFLKIPQYLIIHNHYIILQIYEKYREEQDYNNKNKDYRQLWKERKIYNNCF